jgi:LacI family transcriptional regulator
VTAVFCAGREHTHAALLALAASRVAVIGFGDFDLADLVRPGLTVVTYDPAEVGRKAAELLFRRLNGADAQDEPPAPQVPSQAPSYAAPAPSHAPSGRTEHVEIATRLIARGSGEIPGPG